MIRVFLQLLVFVIGLAVAAILLGEMRHLRQATPDELPLWTGVIRDDARIPSGSAGIAVPGGPGAELRWSGLRPGVSGLIWDLDLGGDLVAARAELLVPYWPDIAVVRNGQGTLDLGGTLYRIERIAASLPVLGSGEGRVEIELDQPLSLPPDIANALGTLVDLDGPILRLTVPAR